MSDNPPSNPVVLRNEGDVAVITMDDGKANAIGWAMIDGLIAALDEADAGAKAVVLAGRPGRFSAGFDLNEIRGPRSYELMMTGGRVGLRLFGMEMPVVIACTGHALAMGAVLLTCADHCVGAGGEFKVGLNEVRIGLPVPDFAVLLAQDRLSRRHLYQATQLATVYDPEGAAAAGFLHEVVPADAAVDRAIERATEWAAELEPKAFARTRHNMRGDLIEALDGVLG